MNTKKGHNKQDSEDILAGLDPKARLFINAMSKEPIYDSQAETINKYRTDFEKLVHTFSKKNDDNLIVKDHLAKLPNRNIKIRSYRNELSAHNFPILYFHGGGFIAGSIETHDHWCRKLCLGTSSIVFSVDYRLAPEHKLPLAANDAFECYIWLTEMQKELNVDFNSCLVAGDSAGATMAIVFSQKHLFDDQSKIALQILINPVTNLANLKSDSHKEFGSILPISTNLTKWLSMHITNKKEELITPICSPLLTSDFSYQPPTLIITSGFDVFLSEEEEYILKLRNAGISVIQHHYPSMLHNFILYDKLFPQSDEVINLIHNEIVKLRKNRKPY